MLGITGAGARHQAVQLTYMHPRTTGRSGRLRVRLSGLPARAPPRQSVLCSSERGSAAGGASQRLASVLRRWMWLMFGHPGKTMSPPSRVGLFLAVLGPRVVAPTTARRAGSGVPLRRRSSGGDISAIAIPSHKVVRTIPRRGRQPSRRCDRIAQRRRAYISRLDVNDVIAVSTATEQVLWRAEVPGCNHPRCRLTSDFCTSRSTTRGCSRSSTRRRTRSSRRSIGEGLTGHSSDRQHVCVGTWNPTTSPWWTSRATRS
jgi:hypothetical protein